jgi:glycosyltransferase involved in cell wall biosynthesis
VDTLPDGPAPTVSVVIPAYDAAATVDAQLDALLARPGDFEVIVADNGSTDDTRAIVEHRRGRDPRVRLVDASARRGPSAARNAGARAARAEQIAFCDADDIVAEGWLTAIVDALGAHDFVTGPVELARLNPPWLVAAKGTTGTQGLVWFEGRFPFASSCNIGIRRDLFLAAGGFDESLDVGEDVDLAMRLYLDGTEVAYTPDGVVHYRYRPDRSDLFKRARAYGASRPELAERLRVRSGTPVPRWRGVRNWLWLVRHVGDLRDPAGQAHWLWTAGLRIGALEGSVHTRHLYL